MASFMPISEICAAFWDPNTNCSLQVLRPKETAGFWRQDSSAK